MPEIIYISYRNNLWWAHTAEKSIGPAFILRTSAVNAAIKYITALGEGKCAELKMKACAGGYSSYWKLGRDEYPPRKKPHKQPQQV